MKITFHKLNKRLEEILLKEGFSGKRSAEIAEVFSVSTFRGVFSHGINRFPRFIREVREGIILPEESPVQLHSFRALEQWDGCRGPGITNALRCSDRSVELAAEYGIGCVGLRNTNHWMRGGSYGWRVAEKGFLFLGWTNTTPNMPPWGGEHPSLGNNPLVMAIPDREGHLVLDMAMSQFSYGKLEWHLKKGLRLPEPGGFDREGKLTSDPGEILETGRILPTGFWKGSGLSMILDLAAAMLSGGNTSRDIGRMTHETGLSQVFISIDLEKHLDREQRQRMIGQTLEFVKGHDPGARFPGQGSHQHWIIHCQTEVEIPESSWQEVLDLTAGPEV